MRVIKNNEEGKRMWFWNVPLETASSIGNWANIFFIASLVVGVLATVVIVQMANIKEWHWDKDRQQSAEKIAALQKESDQLRNDTAEANARALEAKLALEKFKAPRSLSPDQQSKITNAVKSFPNIIYDAAMVPGLADGDSLLKSLELALQAGNWKQVDWRDKTGTALQFKRDHKPIVGVATAVGVIISISPERIDTFGEAAQTLARVLNEVGIEAGATSQNDTNAANTEAIHVVIGNKPAN